MGVNRRDFLKATAFAGAGVVSTGFRFGSGVISPRITRGSKHNRLANSASTTSTGTTPSCLLGAYVNPMRDAPPTAISNFESLIGRKLATTRHYVAWDSVLPGSLIDWSASTGHIPYIGWHAWKNSGTRIPWSSIASGTEDVWIKTQAQALKNAGYPVYFCFHHEPEDDAANGTAAEFKAAYDRVRGIFDTVGTPNLTWVVALMAATFNGRFGGPDAWLPVNYDFLAVDGYNRFPCLTNRPRHSWRSFQELFAPARNTAAAKGKPLFIAESGCVEQNSCGYIGDPSAKATWFTQAEATLKSWPEVVAVEYSHTLASFQGYPTDYHVDSTPASLAAFQSLALDPYFN